MKQLVVATTNKGKLAEIAANLRGVVDNVYSLADFPEIGPIHEDGTTFQENALIKARTVGLITGLPTLADDSGLEVDYLDGRPGVHSARYAGIDASDAANNSLLLRELEGIPLCDRRAAFHCALVLWFSGDRYFTYDGYLPGLILTSPQGEGGFGYDPLFLVEAKQKTLAELTIEEKNDLSHRGRALLQLRSFLVSAKY